MSDDTPDSLIPYDAIVQEALPERRISVRVRFYPSDFDGSLFHIAALYRYVQALPQVSGVTLWHRPATDDDHGNVDCSLVV